MDDFKIQIFKEEKPDDLLQFTTLNIEDSKWVAANILKLAGISDIKTEHLYNLLFKSLKNEVLYNQDVSTAFLKELLSIQFNLSLDAICFVLWDWENGVDLFKLQELLDNWDYIWYDTSDEAMILYFPSKEKIILLTDHGTLKTN